MSQHAPHQGGCLCGAVKLTIDAEPVSSRLCWCRDCQYWAAGSPTFNVLFPREHVQMTGPVSWYESDAASGNHMRRGFCSKCGTHLISDADPAPADGLIRVRAGALDNPELLPPQAIIWTEHAPSWAQFDPALPRFERQPPAPATAADTAKKDS